MSRVRLRVEGVGRIRLRVEVSGGVRFGEL